MHDFDYDVMQKKRIAASARHRVCGSKSRYCGLPSDHLTPAQIKKRSGPVMSYAMNRPMSWENFKDMPHDLQQSYLDGLHNRFGVGAATVSRDVFGMSATGLGQYMRRCGLKMGEGKKMSATERALWEGWLNPPVEVATEAELAATSDWQSKLEASTVLDSPSCYYENESGVHEAPALPEAPVFTGALTPLETPLMPKRVTAELEGDLTLTNLLRALQNLGLPEGKCRIRLEVESIG